LTSNLYNQQIQKRFLGATKSPIGAFAVSIFLLLIARITKAPIRSERRFAFFSALPDSSQIALRAELAPIGSSVNAGIQAYLAFASAKSSVRHR